MPIRRPNVFDRGPAALIPNPSPAIIPVGNPIEAAVGEELSRGPVAEASSMASAEGAAITQALLSAQRAAQPIAARSTALEVGQTIRLANYTAQFSADGTTLTITRHKPEESDSLEQQGIPLMDWAQATMRNKSGGPQLLLILSRLRDEQATAEEPVAVPDSIQPVANERPEDAADVVAAEQESP